MNNEQPRKGPTLRDGLIAAISLFLGNNASNIGDAVSAFIAAFMP